MKHICCLFILLFFSVISFGQSKTKQSILIFSVNFSTRTMVSIPCESFITAFEKQIKTTEVLEEDSLLMLDQYIKLLKFSKMQKNFDFDTRAKIIYTNKSGSKFIICVNNFNILFNGNLIKRDKKFFDFILSLIPKEQLGAHSSSN